jgi:hypothetical protein
MLYAGNRELEVPLLKRAATALAAAILAWFDKYRLKPGSATAGATNETSTASEL